MGYHCQGAANSGASGGSDNLLFLAAGYPGTLEIQPLALRYDDFMDGKYCYIGYDEWYGSPGVNGFEITKYYGPYYFGFGFVEIPPVDGWLNMISSYLDAAGNTIMGQPDGVAAHCNWIYCIVGEPAPGAGWHNTLPDDGFCANYNQGYNRADMMSLELYVQQYIFNRLHSVGNVQYKFNGRYVSYGGGSRSRNILSGLKQYNGSHSWATGWLFTGDSCFQYIRDQYNGLNFYPSCVKDAFSDYSRVGMTANPDMVNYLRVDNDIIVPSIKTVNFQGFPVTATTMSYNHNLLTNREYVYSCAIANNLIFQLKGQFPGYHYPTIDNKGMWLPSFSHGFFYTSEAVSV